ncbi:hypothetical protein FOXYSP1_19901 [Fusarium oxysporum f. sp. phaseoli]
MTSPPCAISYVLSATSFYLDISGSAPSIFPHTTDFCSLNAPAPYGSLPPLQLGSCLTDLCSRVLPRDLLLLCSLGCCLEHNRASTICLTG